MQPANKLVGVAKLVTALALVAAVSVSTGTSFPTAWASGVPGAYPQTEGAHEQIDEQVWRPLLAAADAFDAARFIALQSPDLVRISERTGDVYGLRQYAKEIEDGFDRVRARGDTTRTTEVRFLSRRHSGSLARDTGYFRSRSTRNGVVRTTYTRFDFILQCERGAWRILMDRDSDRTSGDAEGEPRAIEEADFLAATPLSAPPSSNDPTRLAVARTIAPVIDGRIDAQEWRAATRVELAPGTYLRVAHDARHVYLAFDSAGAAGWGFGVLFVAIGDEVSVLHASAKTGSAIYRRDLLKRWSADSPTYVWKDASRLAAEEGWQASVATDDGAYAREFAVRRDRIEGARVAFAYVQQAGDDGRRVHLWPAGLADGAASMALIEGRNPGGLTFDTEGWMTLALLPLDTRRRAEP